MRQVNKIIRSEYHIRAARDQDPRLPAGLLTRHGSPVTPITPITPMTPITPLKPETHRITELLVGAEIAGQYRLDTYVSSGSFAHGWRATDLQTMNEVFVKTFKSRDEFDPGLDSVTASMVAELENAERVMRVGRLMSHPNVVAVLKVWAWVWATLRLLLRWWGWVLRPSL